MGRRWAWLAAGAIAGYAGACGDVSAFACQGDADCVLTGTPGVCEAGNCAYPDDDCPSGFAYPVATPGVGGQCVAGSGATGDTGDDPEPGTVDGGAGTGDGGGTAAVDGSGVDDGTTSTTAMTVGVTSSETATVTSDSGTDDGAEVGSADTAPMCSDDVGDSPLNGSPVGGCEATLESDIRDSSDEDWFAFFGPSGDCPEGEYTANLDDGNGVGLTVCMFAGCEGGGESSADCLDGSQPAVVLGFEGCCGGTNVVAILACPNTPEDDLDPFVAVLGNDDAATCSPYVVEFMLAD